MRLQAKRFLKIIFKVIITSIVTGSCSPDKELAFVPTAQHLIHEHNFYKDFESMSFVAAYGPLNVGALDLQSKGIVTAQNRPCYLVEVNARLKGVAGGFADIENVWSSYIDTTSLLPVQFWRDIKENKYRKKEITRFDRTLLTAIVKDTTQTERIQIKSYTVTQNIEDLVSSFFLFRNVPFNTLAIGDTITIDVFMENASYNARARYLGKEKFRYKGKKTETLVIAPILGNIKMLAGEHPIKVYFSHNAERLPLRASVSTVLGSVALELQNYSTTKR